MSTTGEDRLKARRELRVNEKSYDYFSLDAIQEAGYGDISRLPVSLKVLLENLLRYQDERTVNVKDIKEAANWIETGTSKLEIAYRPARILLQDFTGVPAVVDLAAMRDAMVKLGGNPQKINPVKSVDLVIDHSVMIDEFGQASAFKRNVELEFERNQERYEFLSWGSKAFDNFRVVPPGTGICHQVNLEFLSQSVWVTKDTDGKQIAYPDTVVGTDSHTTMVNGLSVLSWGVGGIEAEAAMLGQPISMLLPEVIGFKLDGELKEGTTATDLVLTVTEMLRKHGVVGKFVEFFGPGVGSLSLPDRATIGNMAPEYGATCGFFPIDRETCNYLSFTGRDSERVALVEAYAKAQGMWRKENTEDPVFTETLSLSLGDVEPSLAGPKRPQDRVILSEVKAVASEAISAHRGRKGTDRNQLERSVGENFEVEDGDVVIAAITSCTNTSNPSVLIAAGLLAKNAVSKGLKSKPWVKTSLAPGSQVVKDYLEKADLQPHLDSLGFNIVGFGCTTCIGNSGPLPERVAAAIDSKDLVASAVLSGNRNFEGRVHQQVRANFLASPPLVVAYALAGTLNVNLETDPIGFSQDGEPVFLREIWPTNNQIQEKIRENLSAEMYRTRYKNAFGGPEAWQQIDSIGTETYDWQEASTYVKYPTFFDGMEREPSKINDIIDARPLLILADSVTTDHISPAGSIQKESPAGEYLIERQIRPAQFNSYGSRRGNHEIMMRGTFANIRIRNEMVPGVEGGYTTHHPSGDQMPVYDAAIRYAEEGVSLVIIGGKEYGTGSSRDWAAKGTKLLGVKAVIVESFERIHRSNLIGMGVLPLEFTGGDTRETLKLDGTESYSISGVSTNLRPRSKLDCVIRRSDSSEKKLTLLCRIDTLDELDYYKHGGILQYVIRNMLEAS